MVNFMNAMAFGLLTSVATAASVRRDKHHAHHHRKAKVACTESSAPYPIANGTTPIAISEASSTATDVAATSSVPVVTVSVVPVPVSPASSAPVAASSVNASPVGASSVGISTVGASAVGGGSGPASSACGGVVTTYVTVQQTIYVTATQPPSTTLTPVAASTKSKKPKTKKPCSVSSAASVPVPSSSAASVPAPSAPAVSAPAPSAPIASAPLPSTSSGAAFIQSSASVATSVATSSSAAPATSSSTVATPVGSGPYSGPKIGVSWDPSSNYDLSSVGLTIPPSWAYDWGQQAHGVPSGVQYVPTLHDASKCAGFAADLAGSVATYVKHFNEPDESGSGGSGLSVSSAVSLHQQYIAPLMDQYLIGLPAVTSNNIPGTSGTGWLTSFVQQLGGCDGFKFADFHFYGGGEDAATQANIFMGYVENWISTVDTICPGKDLPIWISEFSATPVGDTSLATAFMTIVGPQLDSNPRVARYAYWFPENSQIDSVVASVLGSVGL